MDFSECRGRKRSHFLGLKIQEVQGAGIISHWYLRNERRLWWSWVYGQEWAVNIKLLLRHCHQDKLVWTLQSSKSTQETIQPFHSATISHLFQNGNLIDTSARWDSEESWLKKMNNVVSWLAKYVTGTGTEKKDKCVNKHNPNVEVLTSSGNKASLVLKSVYCFYPVFFLKISSLPAEMSAVLSLPVLLKPQRAASHCHRNCS